jgi:hypothetical protein
MYTCGLDVGEKSIHGCCLLNGSPHTVRQFCVTRKPEHLGQQLKKLLQELDVGPCSLKLVAADYSYDIDELLRPHWAIGHPRHQKPRPGAQVDRILLQSYRQQRGWWDRAHLLAYLAIEDDSPEPSTDYELCRQWGLHRIKEKLNQLEEHRARARRPDWLREPTQCLIRPLL